MQRSALVTILVLCACGRLRFDPLATGDGSIADGAGDGGGFAPVRVFYIKATNTGLDDEFGYHLALSADGNTLAVAASLEDGGADGVNGNQADDSAVDAGAVYIYVRSGTTWVPQAYLKASNSDAFDEFGWSLSLSADGNTLAVSARHEDSAATGIGGNQLSNATVDAGAVYVFTRTGTTWSQQEYLKASNPNGDDAFGQVVRLSADGNTLAISTRFEDSAATGIDGNQLDNTAISSGAVYVFTRAGAVWTQQAYVKASNTQTGDFFGEAIALTGDGNTLAVGAMYESSSATGIGGNEADNAAAESGAVYVFSRTGTVWAQTAYVKASNTSANDQFGQHLVWSADGTTLAVAAIFEDSNATGVDGDQTAFAASNSGAVYLFDRASSMVQSAYVKASNTEADDQVGYGLALSGDGNTLAMGAFKEDSAAFGLDADESSNAALDSGAAYVLRHDATSWSQRYIKPPNTSPGDRFGWNVALSGNAATLAVSAPDEDGSATGVDGTPDDSRGNTGAVYIYE